MSEGELLLWVMILWPLIIATVYFFLGFLVAFLFALADSEENPPSKWSKADYELFKEYVRKWPIAVFKLTVELSSKLFRKILIKLLG